MDEIKRKGWIVWLTMRIRFHHLAMDAEPCLTDAWRRHGMRVTKLCQKRAALLTPEERLIIERREGLA